MKRDPASDCTVRRVPTAAGDAALTLVVRHVPDTAVASAHLWFDAGAADEDDARAGTAHFVEHALFKGTPRRGVGDAAAEIEGLGGDLNAWTSWDETCFHATVEADAVEQALDVLFDLTSSPLMDPEELEREKDVVIDEIHGYDDDPDSVASDVAHARLFGDHPYGRPIIGFPKTVRDLRIDDVVAFWRRHYHPGRATLAVAGAVDPHTIEAIVRPMVAAWPPGADRVPTPRAGTLPGGVERVRRDFATVVVQILWPGPPTLHPDLPALDVLQMALFGGDGSRLVGLLDLDRGIASQIRPMHHALLGGGILGVAFQCGETEEAIAATLAAVLEVVERGLPRSEVIRAREGFLCDLLFGQETVDGKAADLAWWTARSGDPRGDLAFRAAVAAVTPEDVARVARAWLRPELARIVVIDKKTNARKLTRALERGHAPARSVSRAVGPVRLEVAGVPVHVLPDGGDIVAIQVTAPGGLLAERSPTAGTSEAWARLATRGVGPWDARTLAERCDMSGIDLGASADRSLMALDMTCPADEILVGTQVLGEALVDPVFDERDWDNVREEMLDDLEAWRDRGGAVAHEALYAALWQGHPWRLRMEGTERSLPRITPERLRRFHRAAFARDQLLVGVAGAVEPERVAALLEPWLSALPRRARQPVPPEPGPIRAPKPARGGHSQAQVLVGARSLPADHPDLTALAVASNLLDSQSGRLFLELRERRGLAYGVWARSEAGRGVGTFSVGLATDPARVEEARTALLDELAQLMAHGPGADELRKVTRMLRGLTALRLERVSARASDLVWSARYGREFGLAGLERRLAQVTPERVRDVLRGVLTDHVVVVVHPLQP
ncbi:MAG: insulinase family protein [Alphaproteobacteria bacterium]|nr:insulinase family protein [Alphaproteobacteria bacterium]MCB9697894.1 insulinase family protein [Alphaproteobacteria bacterium]